jgi:lipoprotein-anchoring transpeptidase ErfK/SrfK
VTFSIVRNLFVLAALTLVAACYNPEAPRDGRAKKVRAADIVEGYGIVEDNGYMLPHIDAKYLAEPNRRAVVPYNGTERAGTIVVDPFAKFLYYVQGDGNAIRYPIAVGREGRGFRGSATIQRKEIWPGWTPTANMLRSEPEIYGPFRGGVPGGLSSPLGARSLYLYRGGADTRYRIHGTNDLESIGRKSSAGCIRMFNQDIIELYDLVDYGTQVRVRTLEESIALEGPELAARNDELGELPPAMPVLQPDGTYMVMRNLLPIGKL